MSLLVLPKNGLQEWPHPHASPRVLLEESKRVTRVSVEAVWATAACVKPESSTNAAATAEVKSGTWSLPLDLLVHNLDVRLRIAELRIGRHRVTLVLRRDPPFPTHDCIQPVDSNRSKPEGTWIDAGCRANPKLPPSQRYGGRAEALAEASRGRTRAAMPPATE